MGRDRSGSGWRKHGVAGWLGDCSARWRVRSRLAGRSRPCPDRRLEAACRALGRASRRTCGRSRSTAAACSPTRPGRGDPASPNRFSPLRLQWRRRRDHRDVVELVGDRAVDEVELHGRLYGGDEELLVAHCPGLFHKPRISGHVNRAPDDSRATHSGVRGATWVRKTGSSDPTFRLIGVRYAESVSAAGQAAKLPLAGLAVVPLRKHSRSQTTSL